MSKNIFFIVFFLFICMTAQAAVKKNVAAVRKPSSILLGEGSIRGGKAGVGFALLAVNSKLGKTKNIERLSVDVGTRAAQKLVGPVAYFNVQNDPRGKRIVIDFSQTLNSKFEESHLRKAFSNSPFVKNAEIVFEPQSQTMSLILNLKKAAAVRVIPVSGSQHRTAKLVLDIFEPHLAKKNISKKTLKK